MLRYLTLAMVAVALGAIGPGSYSRADSMPEGWSMEDYVSYLMFSDLLAEAVEWDKFATALCFANELTTPKDASENVVAALRETFAKTYPSLSFLPKSQCTRSRKGDNLYLYTESVEPLLNCTGTYKAYYTAGGWGGMGYNYERLADGQQMAVRRICMIAGILRAP